ncbi:MAG: hypothetical protein EXR99_08685 [Gemmataceae bacterium]|nr:hypothetical protein [Gemmataceae bacterium]
MFIPNTTCDFFLFPNDPLVATPEASAIPIRLNGAFSSGSRGVFPAFYTHKLLCRVGAAIVDSFPSAQRHLVCVPDFNGTRFEVVLLEQASRGMQRVYLERLQPTWPTEEL